MSEDKSEKEAVDVFLSSSRCMVYVMNGQAESIVASTPSKLKYLDTSLPFAAITAVTTSRIARNQGAASKTLARVLAQDAADGAVASGLGVFEQGFYNRLGYGSGNYEHWIGFDPAWLVPMEKPGVPVRLDVTSAKSIHASRLARRKSHGALDLLPVEISKSEMMWIKKSFGLGYKKGGKVTHCVVMNSGSGENGPYSVHWMTYQSFRQFRELLSLIAGLGDQVRLVRMREPREIQMQDFIRKPFQLQSITKGGKYESMTKAEAYWQMRILQLKPCISALSCPEELTFNLRIIDPVESFLPKNSAWRGCGGDYSVTLGQKSSIKKKFTPGIDILTASIGDFTRFWSGVQSAEALNVTGQFDASEKLLAALDRTVMLPAPAPDWDY